MKRTRSESCQENDDDPPSKLSTEKLRSDVVENSCIKEITESLDAAIGYSAASDKKCLVQTHSKDSKITFFFDTL